MRKLLLSVLILILAMPVAAQSDDLCFNKGGIIDEETGECQLVTNMEISLTYPVELADYSFVLDEVDAYYETVRSQFLDFITSSGSVPVPGPYALDVSYEIPTHNEDLLSIVFYHYEFTGGAHGNTYLQTMTFDLAAETELTLADLFDDGTIPLDDISDYVATTLEDRLGADATFPEGYTADEINFQFWTVAEDGVTFYFPPYQVAPYAAGVQTVTIPYADLGISEIVSGDM